MTDPEKWALAFNAIPDAWKGVAAVLLALFIAALLAKWMPSRRNGK